jgi:hypothetical protein
MPSSMDTKRLKALEEIAQVVGDDLEKVPMQCQDSLSYQQQRRFFAWLLYITRFCDARNITNYPVIYKGRIEQSAFLVEKRKQWKYLIEFN